MLRSGWSYNYYNYNNLITDRSDRLHRSTDRRNCTTFWKLREHSAQPQDLIARRIYHDTSVSSQSVATDSATAAAHDNDLKRSTRITRIHADQQQMLLGTAKGNSNRNCHSNDNRFARIR
jgi:hypothetical protein